MAKTISLITNYKLLIIVLIIASFLRIWKIDQVPVSLFGDELDVGYHALSILKTGRDYSGNPWPLHFQSLAEWRTPLYLYSAVPTVAIFGISPLGVRLPAAVFGILSIWGMYLLIRELGELGKLGRNSKDNQLLALMAAAVLALSPWHLQYSRAGFEATMLLVFLIFGLYFFFRALKNGKFLWMSAALFAFTPWVYSTAKLFTPALLVFLFFIWRKEILRISKRYLFWAAVALVLVGGPIAYATLFGGGAQRFGYISVFTDPTVATEVDTARPRDARMRGEKGAGLVPKSSDRFYHNKATLWIERIVSNYLQGFSSEFLFIKGDPNLRHSINGAGQFYWIEGVALVLGLIFFFTRYNNSNVKKLIAIWLLFGALPSAITRDGGNHATRLILILPPLVFLISFGLVEGFKLVKPHFRRLAYFAYFGIWVLEFGFYQHLYWVHNPWDSERWWHAGFKEAIQLIKSIDANYGRVFLSMSGEPAWIFFAGWYEYPPEKWQEEFPIGNDVEVKGFGKISHIDKFHFGSPNIEGGIHALQKFIGDKDLYLAVAKEVGENLIMKPGRTPAGLELVKAIPYPSGEPAYYLFSGK